METIFILLMGLLVFNGAAWRWGFDSRDSWDSAECERQQDWQAFRQRRTE